MSSRQSTIKALTTPQYYLKVIIENQCVCMGVCTFNWRYCTCTHVCMWYYCVVITIDTWLFSTISWCSHTISISCLSTLQVNGQDHLYTWLDGGEYTLCFFALIGISFCFKGVCIWKRTTTNNRRTVSFVVNCMYSVHVFLVAIPCCVP